jgi:FKBP-type peptidyl-prolyl cis-trans isomerase
MRVIFSFLLLSIFVHACKNDPTKKELPFNSKEEYEETIIASHQNFLKIEKEKILKFIDSTGYEFQKTGTGLRFCITDSSKGDGFSSSDIAVIRYQLKSIEGELLYETRPELAQEFAVDYDEVETGLHEAIKFMKVGEKAIVILPTHLAHGITGDRAAIKTQTTLVYYLNVIGKK